MRIGPRAGIVAAALALALALAGLILWDSGRVAARPDLADATLIAEGERVYTAHCASCHGRRLEGQPNWRDRLPSGRLPAPPHDDSGHTWHHPFDVLFGITKYGLVPPYGPKDYASDMPGFEETLGDPQIWAVLAYIRSRWSDKIRTAHDRIEQQSASR